MFEFGIILVSVFESVYVKGILYCDIKFGNVGYMVVGILKFFDFGLVKFIDGFEVFWELVCIVFGRVFLDDVIEVLIMCI